MVSTCRHAYLARERLHFTRNVGSREDDAMYWGWGFGGMNLLWWLFWVVAIAMFFGFAVPVPRRRYQQLRETPLDLLRRRYAAGELTTAEFDERMERLDAARSGQDLPRTIRASPTKTPPTGEHPPH